jgi:hypothetical protein
LLSWRIENLSHDSQLHHFSLLCHFGCGFAALGSLRLKVFVTLVAASLRQDQCELSQCGRKGDQI